MITKPNHYVYPLSEFQDNSLTKREYFAAMAMQGLLMGDGMTPDTIGKAAEMIGVAVKEYDGAKHYPILIAKCATVAADALIEALNKEAKEL